VAIEAGHGGQHYWGASARDAAGHLWIEKDLALDVSLRLQVLLAEMGYSTIMVRPGDYTLTEFDPWDYRPSLIAEAQARVDVANDVRADALVSVHFNGWLDASQTGTETYCNPDRSFGHESCALAWYVQDALVRRIREAGYDVNDRGVRNDADVSGDPQNPHSFLLGTNANFRPSLMPGVISEVLFLSSPPDLEFLRRPDALDIIARALAEGIDAYFRWLNVPG
jgi:N-acetylmuramoyl-L-alanine amidase